MDCLRDDGFEALSTGRRGLDLAGFPGRQNSFNSPYVTRETDSSSSMIRKPFSPISSTDSSMSNAANIFDDLNRKHNEMLQKTLTSSNNNNNTMSCSTPASKTMSTAEIENRTPQATPSTVCSSIPMSMAITTTPAVTKQMIVPAKSTAGEEIEYSFEERRAGFVVGPR
ncbi:hypothetical protein OROGR_011252 [Orobanche gracilis]